MDSKDVLLHRKSPKAWFTIWSKSDIYVIHCGGWFSDNMGDCCRLIFKLDDPKEIL